MIPYYVVQDIQTREILEGMPTPHLISNGRGEAYLKDGIWYMKDVKRGYSADSYRDVRVIRNPESLEQERRLYTYLRD